jgi:Oxidoreductase molybdopterin binding domain
MIGARAFVVAILLSFAAAPLSAADQIKPSGPASETAAAHAVELEGKLKHPQSLDLVALRRLPAEQVQVSFQSERPTTPTNYTGVRLWAVLAAAGGIDDDEKGAELRHIIKVTGRDGYVVLISTGEIAPDFGGKPALIAYQRDGDPLGEAGFRLIMPGDKRGGRNVRDVVAIRIE